MVRWPQRWRLRDQRRERAIEFIPEFRIPVREVANGDSAPRSRGVHSVRVGERRRDLVPLAIRRTEGTERADLSERWLDPDGAVTQPRKRRAGADGELPAGPDAYPATGSPSSLGLVTISKRHSPQRLRASCFSAVRLGAGRKSVPVLVPVERRNWPKRSETDRNEISANRSESLRLSSQIGVFRLRLEPIPKLDVAGSIPVARSLEKAPSDGAFVVSGVSTRQGARERSP